jgi:hypothetical protein
MRETIMAIMNKGTTVRTG